MSDSMKYLKKHLKSQIATADKLDSKWVYILRTEAEKCLELAEKHTQKEKQDGD